MKWVRLFCLHSMYTKTMYKWKRMFKKKMNQEQNEMRKITTEELNHISCQWTWTIKKRMRPIQVQCIYCASTNSPKIIIDSLEFFTRYSHATWEVIQGSCVAYLFICYNQPTIVFFYCLLLVRSAHLPSVTHTIWMVASEVILLDLF